MNIEKLVKLFAVVASASVLVACGGGGSSSGSAPTGATPAPAPVPSPAPAPSPSPSPAPVATIPAGASPVVSSASCAGLQAVSVPAPAITAADMQSVSDVLTATDPQHGYAEFARLPAIFMWWVRTSPSVNMDSISTAIHESNHVADLNLLSQACNTDGLARYYADSQAHVTGLSNSGTDNYSIVSETYPSALKAPRALRYDLYVTGSASSNGNRFNVLLDELNAYSGAANFEAKLLASSYSYLATPGDKNAGGMVDFMLFTQSYLKAARLNHPASYVAIQSSGQTLAYLQFAWTRAERILATMYPYSVSAGGGQGVPVDVIAQIYSAPFLSELDALGIAHKTAADWSTTYLR
ncbi:MAG: hypothetical protein ABI702_06105 [Burkholderiales bacterium]